MSRHWGHEWIGTLQFLGIGLAALLVIGGIVAGVLIATTDLGHHFWVVNRGFFFRQSPGELVAVWASLLGMGVLLLGSVRVTYLLTYQTSDMYNAIQAASAALSGHSSHLLQQSKSMFWDSLRIFSIVVAFDVVRYCFASTLWYRFECRWRSWLTVELCGDWLGEDAAYRARFTAESGDNPDQRIEFDITYMVEYSQTLIGGGLNALVSIVAFTPLLWGLSTTVHFFGVSIPRAVLIVSFAFFFVSTVVTWIIGRPMIRWNFRYQRRTGDFRAQLVRTRIAAEEVALADGSERERGRLASMFRGVIHNFWRQSLFLIGVGSWSRATDQAAVLLPWLVQVPRFFKGQIPLGVVTQTAAAFQQMQQSLSFFQDNYQYYAEYRAQLIRLHGLTITNRDARAIDIPPVGVPPAGVAVRLSDAGVDAPDGSALLRGVNVTVPQGSSLLIQGPSGVGKSTLIRALSGVWPYVHGEFDASDPYVVTQTPYLPRGTMRELLGYPGSGDEITDDEASRVLSAVGLPNLSPGDYHEDWSFLSPGERQRVVFARMLLARPSTVLLDEATSAVDAATEARMYDLLRSELPDSAVISVGHRQTLVDHHDQTLDLSAAR